MNKSFSLFMVSSIVAFQASVDGWSNSSASPFGSEDLSKKQAESIDGRKGIFELDYLFWKPFQEDLNYAVRTTTTVDGATTYQKYRPKSPSFNLSSGVRLGFGGYTGDVWDIKARGTYLYSQVSKNSHANASETLSPSLFPILAGQNGVAASASWRLNFGLLDLTLGRETYLTPKFNIHPFIGIRAAWIRETFNGRFKGTADSVIATLHTAKINNTNNVWGIGPRAGLDSDFYFANNWAFRGGLSGALVIGNFNTSQNLTSGTTVPGNVIKANLKDHQEMVRTNLDGYLGIGWDKWFDNNSKRMYVAVLCETSYWFGINQLVDLNISEVGTPATQSVVAEKRNGDLAFFGGTVHFQLDF